MDNKNLTIVAISALASLLATGTVMSSEITFACEHHHSKSIRQTTAQDNACGNGIMSLDNNCRNLDDHVNGNHNAAKITGIQASSLDDLDHNSGGHDDHGSSPSDYIPAGNPITGADP